MTIFILEVDLTIKEDEVKLALARKIKVKENEVEIRAIRKGKFDQLTVIAEVPRKQVMPLIRRRKVRLGWIKCGIRKRVDITRCFRCLEYGHKTRECTAQVDRSKDCIKCGEPGHKGKECTNKDRCTICCSEGHRTDQIKCPHFKKLVEGKRRQKVQLGETEVNRI